MQGPALPIELAERLSFAEAHCLEGFAQLWRSELLSLDPAEVRKLGGVRVPDPTCVRLVAVADPNSASFSVTLKDEQGQALAAGHGRSVAILPPEGPLCLPQGSSVAIEVATNTAPASVRLALLHPEPGPATH